MKTETTREVACMERLLVLLLLASGCAAEVGDRELDAPVEVKAVDSALYYGVNDRWALSAPPRNDGLEICFTNLASFPTEAGWFKEAVRNTWDKHSAINFIGFGQCPVSGFRGIRVQIGPDNLSAGCGGMPPSGVTDLRVGTFRSGFDPGTTCALDPKRCMQWASIHELGHCLTFQHEYIRPNTPAGCPPGNPPNPNYIEVGPYDRFSVMNGSQVCSQAPYATSLSAGDIAGVRQAYGTPAQRLAMMNPSTNPFTWNIDIDGDTVFNPVIDRQVRFGSSGQPIAGAFGTSVTYLSRIGTFNAGTWQLDWNNNGVWDGPAIDRSFGFGTAGDVPVPGRFIRGFFSYPAVIAVFRQGTFYIDWNNDGAWSGAADRQYLFRPFAAGDVPVIGAWANVDVDRVGIYNNGNWFLDTDGNYTLTAADRIYTFNPAGQFARPMPADYTGDGIAELAVFKGGALWIDWNNNGRWDGPSVDRVHTNVLYLPVPGLFSAKG
jgi:hypothetical protein